MKTVLAAFLAVSLAGALPAAGANVTYHGGPVIVTAKVVYIFWGPSFANILSPDHAYATTLQSFRNNFGTTATYGVITQYSSIQQSNLGAGTADWFDTSTPPANVTDADVQSEILIYLASHTFNASTVYEVFLPSTSYSSVGSATSCGGTNVQYCDYHNDFTNAGHDVKYAVQPYPSCSACQIATWSAVREQELFVCRDTLDSVTDPDFNAWFDSAGSEVASKCAPPPNNSTVACCVWSNQVKGCLC